MIIGFGYKAFCGKDTAAEHLVKHYGFTRRAFADALKEAASAIFGLSWDQMYTGKGKETVDEFWEVTPRYILQKVGTECMRQGYAQDIWVKALHRFILNNRQCQHWAVPDVRFPNEAAAIKSWGGIVFRINRGEHELVGIDKHASETSMDSYDKWDGVLDNTGTLEQLYAQVDDIMSLYGIKKETP